MKRAPIAIDLPSQHAAGVGRIVTHWAYLEWRLKHIGYLVANVSPKFGRIAMQEPNASGYVRMIVNLLHLRGLPAMMNTKRLAADCDIGEEWRNRFAHSIWVRRADKKGIFIQAVRGTWEPKPGASLNRRITPQGIRITPALLKSILAQIDQTGSVLEAWYQVIQHKLATLPQKSGEQLPPADPTLIHDPKKRRGQRRSSHR